MTEYRRYLTKPPPQHSFNNNQAPSFPAHHAVGVTAVARTVNIIVVVLVEDVVVVVVSSPDAVPTPPADTTLGVADAPTDVVGKEDVLVTRAIRTSKLLEVVLQLVERSPKPLL